ncbi:MAG: hypothetical protein ABFS86_20960, partial [Planctomycetota bacterium]
KKEVNPKVAEFFDDLETNLSELVRRRPGGGRLTPEDRARLLERIEARLGGRKVEYEIVTSESVYWKDSARVVVRCPALAEALGLKKDRLPVDVRRDPRNGTWRLLPRRRPER